MPKPAMMHDRSLAFTALLEVPEFRAMDNNLTAGVITEFLTDWRNADDATNMVRYAKFWFYRRMMRFTLTVRYPKGGGQRDENDLPTMQAELGQLARVLDALVVGETVTIERIS